MTRIIVCSALYWSDRLRQERRDNAPLKEGAIKLEVASRLTQQVEPSPLMQRAQSEPVFLEEAARVQVDEAARAVRREAREYG